MGLSVDDCPVLPDAECRARGCYPSTRGVKFMKRSSRARENAAITANRPWLGSKEG